MTPLLHRMRRRPFHFALLYLSAPLIYGMLLPIAVADGFATLYQHVCFRVYGIPRVRRRDHLMFDRARLSGLGWLDKLNCIYCEYANGVVAYVQEILARTEWYWCPVKHRRDVARPHAHYDRFMAYDAADNAFHTLRKAARQQCRACEEPKP